MNLMSCIKLAILLIVNVICEILILTLHCAALRKVQLALV